MDTRYSNSQDSLSSPTTSGIEEDSGAETSSYGQGDEVALQDTQTTLTYPPMPSLFPATRYNHLLDGLLKTPTWVVHPVDLAMCLGAASRMFREPLRATLPDRLYVKRLFRESLQLAFSKCCEERCITRWDDHVHHDILMAARELCELTCVRMKIFRDYPPRNMEDIADAEEDMAYLLGAMGVVFDPSCVFHEYNQHKPLPTDNGHKVYPLTWAGTQVGSPARSDSRGGSVDEILDERHSWLINLINCFGESEGFTLLADLIGKQHMVSWSTLDYMIHPVAKVVQLLLPDTLALLTDPIKALLARIQTVLETDVEQLCEARDRVFNATSNILAKAYNILAQCDSPPCADAVVGEVQRTFVLKMLGFNKFERQLVAVREINALLKRSMEIHKLDEGQSMEINMAWLKSHDIVKQLLKSNLHQKQYVDQVQKVLKQLTVEGSLQADHVELLCNLTEKADQSVSVKDNVYAMLNYLAQDFTIDQLDLMFNKFEGSPVSVLADALKVVQLTRNLAKSDTKGVNADRVMRLLWKMGMHPHHFVEVQKELPVVLRSYAGTELGLATLSDYFAKCIEQLQHGENAGIAVSMLATLVQAVASDTVDRAETVAALERKYHLLDTVISSLEAHQRSFYHTMAETGQSTMNGQSHQFEDADFAVELHDKTVWGHLDFCALLTRIMEKSLSIPHAERIWDSLIRQDGTGPRSLPQDVRFCFEFFQNAVKRFMDIPAASHMLVTKLTNFPAEEVDVPAWATIWFLIEQVGMSECKLVREVDPDDDVMMHSPGQLKPLMTASLDIKGLPYAWNVALDCKDQIVAQDVRARLVSLYTSLTGPLLEQAAIPREQMLTLCVNRLLEAAQGILGISTDPATWRNHVAVQPRLQAMTPMYDMASQRATRCLYFLSDMVMTCQGDTMPARPVHAASSRGDAVVLELTGCINPAGHTAGRMQLTTHSNAFLGQLRRQVAAKINSEAPFVRMFIFGRELKGDGKLLCDARVQSGPIMVTVGAVRNAYSEPSPEARAQAEALSPSLLLSQRPGFADLLLCLADSAVHAGLRTAAQALLDILPTDIAVLRDLRAACMSDAPNARFAELLGCAGPALQWVARPARLMYTLQALISLMFLPDEGWETPAAANGGEQLQQLFVSGGCLSVTLEAVKLNVDELASRGSDADVVAVRCLSRTALSLINGLSHLVIPSGERRIHPDVHRLTGQQLGALDPTWVEDQRDSAVSMSVDASGGGPSSSETSTGRPDLPPAPPPAPPDTDNSREANVNNVMLFYVMLARQAGRGWGREFQTNIGAEPLGPDPDSQLSQDALKSLETLLEQHTYLLHPLLQDAETCDMAIDGLLSPQHESVRNNMSRFLTWVSSQPFGQSWLLNTLRVGMPRADSAPRNARTYYSLFCDTVKGIPEMVPEVQRHAMRAAREVLDGMVAASSSFWLEDESSCCLEGKLQLLLALVQVLNAADVGTPAGGGLVKSLLTECLFPEAWLSVVHGAPLQMASLPVSDLQIIMGARSKTKESRKAAFDLLSELVTSNMENMREAITLIQRLHINSQFVGNMSELFAFQPTRDLRPRHKFVGLKNPSATCYMNAVFQQLFMQPSIRHLVLSAPESPVLDHNLDNVFHELQRTFCGLAYSNTEYFIPQGFWHAFKDYDGEPLNVREHQDAYEFFTRLQDLVDQQMRDAGATPAMQAVMGGKFAQQIVCKSINYRSEREEDFYQLSLEVRGKKNLEESLDLYVSSELMEGDNQYLCEELGKKVDASKRNCIKVLPHMLVLQLKRFEFDYETMTRWKIKDRFEFPVELDMYKYTVEGLAAREEALESGGDPVSPKAPLEDRTKYNYQLKGVLVHSGTAFAGHYYSYIQDREGRMGLRVPGLWYVFDDLNVDLWDIAKLEPDCFGGKCIGEMFPDQDIYERAHSAYMLIYERDEALEPIKHGQLQAGAQLRPSEANEAAAWRPEGVSSASAVQPPSSDVLMSPGATLPDAPPLDERVKGNEKEDVSMGPEPAMSDVLMSPDVHRPDNSRPHHQRQASEIMFASAAVPVPDITLSVPSIYQGIMEMNLRVIQEAHLFDPDYFRFIRRLVESHTQALTPKMRRMDHSPTRSPTSGASGNERSGEERLVPASSRSMASPWRSEESQQLGKTLMNLTMQFLLKVYLHANSILRDDMKEWKSAILALMEANPVMPRLVLAMLTGTLPAGDDTDEDEDVVEFDSNGCLRVLFYCDVEDVRAFVAYMMNRALRTAVRNDNGVDTGAPTSKSRNHSCPNAAAVMGTLETLKGWLGHRRVVAVSSKVYVDAYFAILKGFASIGPKQRTQLYDMGFVHPLVTIAQKYGEMFMRTWLEVHESAFCAVVAVLSPLIRRWDLQEIVFEVERETLPNPYRVKDDPAHIMQKRSPSCMDLYTGITNSAVIGTLIEANVLHSPEPRKLLQFLMFENRNVSVSFLNELSRFLRKPGPANYYGIEQDVMEVCVLHDRYWVPRMENLIHGHTMPRFGLVDVVARQGSELNRYMGIKLLLKLVMNHLPLKDKVASLAIPWQDLYPWVLNGGPFREGSRNHDRDPEINWVQSSLVLLLSPAPQTWRDDPDDDAGDGSSVGTPSPDASPGS